ncbi:MAG: RNase adapter RapZ [Ectothiorhodospiraceae bacterium]|nr:RNase adapter RapZ [Ectothiorhodospiraceae bacterium]
MKLVIVSGLSGAGKSIAMHALEDLGYYCVDNLPLGLLPALASTLGNVPGRRHELVAVAIDARNSAADFERFGEIMDEISALGVESRVVFIEADEDVLLKRFSETRRRHPLTADDVSLGEALAQERTLLAPVRRKADLRLDTSQTHVHQLRDLVRSRIDERPLSRLALLFESFGYKHGLPQDADFVFDVRFLPNPHWEPDLRNLTGRDAEVRRFLESQPAVEDVVWQVTGLLERWIPAFEADNRAYLTVAIGCTGGQHRSVYIAERLAEHFRSRRPGVMVRHREIT